MAVNFEIDFIQPLLLDLENGEYKDIQDYVDAITRYYANTIAGGNPVGIPPTLPSPITVGVTVPIAVTPQNGYSEVYNKASQSKFNRTLSAYYNAKQLLLTKESIKVKNQTLQGIVRKADYEKKLIQARIELIRTLSQEVRRLPEHVQVIADAANMLVGKYKEEVKTLPNDIIAQVQDFQLPNTTPQESFKQFFPEEARVLDTIQKLKFSSVQEAVNSSATISRYIQKAINFQEPDERKRFVKTKATQAATKIVKIITGLLNPESFGAIIEEAQIDIRSIDQSTSLTLERAKVAVDSVKVIKFILEPEIRTVERWIEVKKKNLEERAKTTIKNQKESIDKKVDELKKRKDKSEKKKLFEKFIADAKELKKQNEDLIKTTKKNIKTLTVIGSKAVAITQSLLEVRASILGLLEKYKTRIDELQQTASSESVTRELSREVDSYLTMRGASDLIQPVKQLIQDKAISFQDVRILLEDTSKDFDILKNRINTINEEFKEIENELRKLENLPPLKNVKGEERTRKRSRDGESIVSVFSLLTEILEKVRTFKNKQVKKAEAFSKRQIKKAKKITEDIEIAAINALPIPTKSQDAQTKKEAAEEKKREIEQFKVKLKNAQKKAQAAYLFGTNASLLVTNLSNGDVLATKNESILNKLATARFQYNTVGIDPKSPEYGRQEAEKQRFIKEVEALREIEMYVSILISIVNDVKQASVEDAVNGVRASFVDDLKNTYNQVVQAASETGATFANGNVGQIAPTIGVVLGTIENLVSSKSTNPLDYIKTIKGLKRQISKGVLEEALRSTSLIYTLQQVEDRYLLQTKKLLTQLIGGTEPNEIPQESSMQGAGPIASFNRNRKEEIEQKRRLAKERLGNSELYSQLEKLQKTLAEGRGSLIGFILDLIVDKLNQFETFVRKEITALILRQKKKAEEQIEKIKKEHEERLKLIAEKRIKNDLVPQSIALNIALSLFWIGAVWQNTQATTFQVLSVAPFKRLRVDGKLDGVEATVRELATNLQKQLNTVQGLVIPNPATGIPPLPFVGYK